MRRDWSKDEEAEEEAPTAQPSVYPRAHDDVDAKLVPNGNVGGAAPTPLGADSGGDLPGVLDDLENLAEPEPPQPPELEAMHIRDDAGPGPGRRR